MNTFGQLFRIHSFGESHGSAMGVVIDGCPAGVHWQENLIKSNLQRRRPGQSQIVSDRQEAEDFEVLSGVYKGKTLGTPIAIVVKNQNAKSSDYLNEQGELKFADRSGHADDVWREKYGHSDPRGGGRSSGRETLSRVLAGSVAQMFVKQIQPETQVASFVQSIGEISLDSIDFQNIEKKLYNSHLWENHSTRLPSKEKHHLAEELLIKAKEEGKSYGGIARVMIFHPPKFLGQPVFHKLKSTLASAYMSIGAVNGVEMGEGFSSTFHEGSEFHSSQDQKVYGGIRGGISTGETIDFKVAFKPTSSVLDVAKKGRHDPCIVPRAIPVLEAMSFLVLAESLLWQRLDKV